MKEPETFEEALLELREAWQDLEDAILEQLQKTDLNAMDIAFVISTGWLAFCWASSLL